MDRPTAAVAIDLPMPAIREFCERWKIREFALFGSVLRDDFGPESDIDVMVSFAEDAHWSLFDHVGMQDELAEIFGRRVDLVTRAGVETSHNPYRRRRILDSARVVYTP
jgi:predicted nucleotidyltransferase